MKVGLIVGVPCEVTENACRRGRVNAERARCFATQGSRTAHAEFAGVRWTCFLLGDEVQLAGNDGDRTSHSAVDQLLRRVDATQS